MIIPSSKREIEETARNYLAGLKKSANSSRDPVAPLSGKMLEQRNVKALRLHFHEWMNVMRIISASFNRSRYIYILGLPSNLFFCLQTLAAVGN